MARQYVVDGQKFGTQKELLSHIQGILHSYAHGETVNEEHLRFLYSLVDTYHPSSELKLGVGVAYIEVRKNPLYKTNQGFWIIRTDGTETDFSFMECLRRSSPLDKLRSACRNAIAPTIAEEKKRYWGKAAQRRCKVTGRMMTFAESHVHHAGEWSFDRIVNEFVAEHIPDINAVKLTGSLDGQIGDHFDSQELKQRFIEYHNARARLEVVSAIANLSVVKRNEPEQAGGQLSLFDNLELV